MPISAFSMFLREATTSVRFCSARCTAASTSTAIGSAVGWSVGTIRMPQLAGSFLGKITRRMLSSASWRALSATITPSARDATSLSAATTSRGARVPTFTLIWFSSRSFWARDRLLRATSRLSMAKIRS
jgi:hypothetical protein